MSKLSCLAVIMSLVFPRSNVPKKHKQGRQPDQEEFRTAHRHLIESVPGMEAMESLLQRLDGVLFCIKDRAGRYLSANDAFFRRIGVSDRHDLIGRTSREVFPELLAAGYQQQDSTIFSTEAEMRDRLEMITNPDGSLGWYLSNKVPVRDSNGDVVAIAGISRDLHLPATGDPRLEKLATAIEHMRAHFAETIRISVIAEKTGMSLSRFERLMRSLLRVSPRQFLTRLRVEAAADRLRKTNDQMATIALDCGFCDQATFSRQFKATTGMTAGKYRTLSRQEMKRIQS